MLRCKTWFSKSVEMFVIVQNDYTINYFFSTVNPNPKYKTATLIIISGNYVTSSNSLNHLTRVFVIFRLYPRTTECFDLVHSRETSPIFTQSEKIMSRENDKNNCPRNHI